MPLPKFPPDPEEWLPGKPFEEPPLPAFLRDQETMFFNVPEAREQLANKGFVYTLRPKMRRTGKDMAYYGSYFKKEKIGPILVDFIREVKEPEEVKKYVSGSGFKNLQDWWKVAEGSKFLFKVKRL